MTLEQLGLDSDSPNGSGGKGVLQLRAGLGSLCGLFFLWALYMSHLALRVKVVII